MKLLFSKEVNTCIFFMHVPKTGGTSVDDALRKHYRENSSHIAASASYQAAQVCWGDGLHSAIDYNCCFRFRESLLSYEMAKGKKYISGHVPFNQKIWNTYGKKYKYVTVLRHPVKRYLSNYYYNRYKDSDHCKLTVSLHDFLDSDVGKSWGYEYIKFFAGIQEGQDYTSRLLIDEAKENSRKFNTIGILENLDGFTKKIKTDYAVNLNIPHKRKNPKAGYDVSESELEKIEAICRADLELYDFVQA